MATITDPNERARRVHRFMQLPARSLDVWQGALVRMPEWVTDDGEREPYRPLVAMWLSITTGEAEIEAARGVDVPDLDLLVDGLLRLGQRERKARDARAGRLQVTDPAARDHLERVLGPGMSVEVVSRLDLLDDLLAAYADNVAAEQVPGMLDAPGVTIEDVRAFADAAARFYHAAPWRHLTSEDLIRIESDVPAPGYRYATVLGDAGMQYGIGFYRSVEAYEAVLDVRSERDMEKALADSRAVQFGGPDGIPWRDYELWAGQQLPLAGPQAYPFAARYLERHDVRRPSQAELQFLSALLVALAETSEQQMESGHWTRPVVVAGRRTEVALALPGAVEPDAPATASTPLERAQEVCYQAFDAPGRRRHALARRALELSPDCADAYVILAEKEREPEKRLALYEQGIAAGRRALGVRYQELVGSFWGDVTTRPYMRAAMGRANVLAELGRREEAIADYQEMLRLNPDDNQGVRFIAIGLLFEAGRDRDAEALLDQYADDGSATLAYARVLAAFRKHGDGQHVRAALAQAMEVNRWGAAYLLDWNFADSSSIDAYRPGGEDEALVCADEIGAAWDKTRGALDWLRARHDEIQANSPAQSRRTARKRRKRRR